MMLAFIQHKAAIQQTELNQIVQQKHAETLLLLLFLLLLMFQCVHLQSLPTVNGFLEASIAALPGWRKILPNYPVVSWLSFVEYVRATVNSLASDGHIRELVCQLQLVGEVLMLYALSLTQSIRQPFLAFCKKTDRKSV